MFGTLKNALNQNEATAEAGLIMSELCEAVEDDIMENIAISTDEEAKITQLLNKIPGDDFTTKDTPITEKDMKAEIDKQPDPTIEELLSGDL